MTTKVKGSVFTFEDNKEDLGQFLLSLGDYVDDATAAIGGVEVGGLYRSASTIKVRVS